MTTTLAIATELFLFRATLLLAVFWAFYLCLRSHPRARVMLCRLVSLALVLLPFVQFVPAPTVASLPNPSVMSEPAFGPFESVPTTPVPQTTTPSIPNPPLATSISIHFPTLSFYGLLLTLWTAGVALLVTRWLISLLIARKLALASHAAPTWAKEMSASFSIDLKLHRDPKISIHDHISSPLLLGPFPTILLPKRLFTTDAREDILSALAHELAHVKARDWFWSQWLHLVTAFTWPIPLAWYLRQAHDASSELVCDQAASAVVGGAESYAGSLARQSLHALGHPYLATVPMLRRSGIRRRLDQLLSGAGLPALSHHTAGLLAGFTLAFTCLLAGIHLAQADDGLPADTKAWREQNYTAPEVQKILAQLFGYFQPITALAYAGTEVTLLGPAQGNGKIVNGTRFMGTADRYFIELTSTLISSTGQYAATKTDRDADNAYHAMAFNGHEYQELSRSLHEKDLTLIKGPPFWPVAPSLNRLNKHAYFTMPFDFVGMSLTTDPAHPVVLTPELYKQPENWAIKTRGFRNGTLLGKRGLIMTVQGTVWDGSNTSISVLLDPAKNYYPVAWQFQLFPTGQDIDLVSYQITDLETLQAGNVSIPYPKVATISTTHNGKPNWTRTITIDAFLNDLLPEDPRFTIDPHQADFIQKDGGPKAAVAKQ